jgi:hypothetical protein
LPLLDVDTNKKDKLAILPLQLDGSADSRDADTLAQILSIELLKNQNYAIYPRTQSLDQVQKEFDTQFSGITADSNIAQFGVAENPTIVLSVAARKLGTMNRFNASIIDLESGTQVQGLSEQYGTMSDGIPAMGIIAKTLSGQSLTRIEQRRRAASVSSTTKQEKVAAATGKFLEKSGIVIGLQGGFNMAPNDDNDDKIFGEPQGVTATSEEKGKGGGFVEPIIGFKTSWFFIQTGAHFGIGYPGPSAISYTFLQIPVLAGVEFFPRDLLGISFYGGVGFNVPIKASASINGKTNTVELTMPMNVIAGGGVSMKYADFILYVNIQGVFDLDETEAKLESGESGSFNRSPVELMVGLKYWFSFKKL